MINPFKWIRWKFVIPFIILIALIVIFFRVFFDPLLEAGLEKIGGKINRARVDISGLHTKIFRGRITIQDIQVADPDIEMKNTIQMGPLAFEMDFPQLLTKRFIVPEAKMDGIRFATDRKVSGKLIIKPKKKRKDGKPSVVARLAEKYEKQFVLTLDTVKGDAKKKIEFDPKQTQIVKQSNAIKDKATALPNEWETRVKNLDVEGRLKKAEKDLKTVKETKTDGVQALVAIPQAIQKLGQVKTDIKQIKTDVEDTKTSLQAEIKNLKDQVKALEDAKQADINELASRFNLDFADPKRLVEGIVGPVVLTRAKKIMGYVEMVREHMPSKKEQEAIPQKPRATGMDILFPRPQDPPRMWLKNASLSGQFEKIALAGSLLDLNTNPARVKKPTVLKMKGQKEGSVFDLLASIDHTTDIKKDGFSLSASNLSVPQFVSSGAFGKSISQGRADARLALNAIGKSDIGGHIQFELSALQFDREKLFGELKLPALGSKVKIEDELKLSFVQNLVTSIEAMPQIQINAKIKGTWDDPSLEISSNLENVFSRVIKETIGNVVREQKQKLEAEVNKILEREKAELSAKINQFQTQYLDKMGLMDGQIQALLTDATGINLTPQAAPQPTPPAGETPGQTPPAEPAAPLIKDLKKIFK